MRFKYFSVILSGVLVLMSGGVQAHFPWIETVETTQGPSVEVRFGHGPSDATPLSADRLATLLSINRAGERQPLPLAPVDQTQFVLPDDALLAAATQAPGYWSRQAEGGERRPRNEVPDALGCTYSRNGVKVLTDSLDRTALTTAVGHALEIIPVSAPRRDNDQWNLPVTVAFEAGTYTGRISLIALDGDERPALFDADTQGHYAINVPRPGRWMLYARTTTVYPNPDVCDENGYNATLVLTLPPS